MAPDAQTACASTPVPFYQPSQRQPQQPWKLGQSSVWTLPHMLAHYLVGIMPITSEPRGKTIKLEQLALVVGWGDTILGWRDAPIIVSVTVLDADLFSSRCPLGLGAAGGGVPSCGIALATGAGIACCSAILARPTSSLRWPGSIRLSSASAVPGAWSFRV